jgi:hypothetical protein
LAAHHAFHRQTAPKVLEFPSCDACNQGSKLADHVASLFSRVYPDLTSEQGKADTIRLLRAIRNNVPALLEELFIGAGGQKLARRDHADYVPEGGGFIRVDGPILHDYLLTFAAKMGLALHFEETQRFVPCGGALLPRWFSNLQHFQGEIPSTLLDVLPAPRTLRQGRKQVEEQFQYSSTMANDGTFGIHFASFRLSFAVCCVTAVDASLLKPLPDSPWPTVSPPLFR